jgi:hypothetical protein
MNFKRRFTLFCLLPRFLLLRCALLLLLLLFLGIRSLFVAWRGADHGARALRRNAELRREHALLGTTRVHHHQPESADNSMFMFAVFLSVNEKVLLAFL